MVKKEVQKAPRICVGAFSSAHGIHGQLKLKSFTENPEDILRYLPLEDESGTRLFSLKKQGKSGDLLIVSIEGVVTRNDAELLRGQKLYASVELLPALSADEFYVQSLIGCEVFSPENIALGVVTAIHNYGASDILAIQEPSGEESLYAFTHQNFPEVDLTARRLTFCKPEEI